MNFIPERQRQILFKSAALKQRVYVANGHEGFDRPVSVWKQWSLKTSVSSISIPELPTSGDNCEPIANNLVDDTNAR